MEIAICFSPGKKSYVTEEVSTISDYNRDTYFWLLLHVYPCCKGCMQIINNYSDFHMW